MLVIVGMGPAIKEPMDLLGNWLSPLPSSLYSKGPGFLAVTGDLGH